MKTLLKRAVHRVIDSYVRSRALDIDLQRQMLAGISTARFLERHAFKAQCFTTRDGILAHAAELARGNAGLICEFGVYRGASINTLARLLPERQIFGFDSFEGLPEAWRDEYDAGAFDVNGSLPAVRSNVHLIKGWFCDSLQQFLNLHREPMALVHIDCDLYTSTRTVLPALAERIQVGTVLLFDEYFNYPGWQQHEHKAFCELRRGHPLNFEYLAYNSSHQQVIVRCTA
jgi:predicted O-methyltransferase YrrM